MALHLPVELQQQTLLLLDSSSFYSASRTCQSWRRVALAPYVLRQQIQSTPLADSLHNEAAHSDLVSFFHRFVRYNLLGFECHKQRTCSEYIRHESFDKASNTGLGDISWTRHSAQRSRLENQLPVRNQDGILWADLRGLDLTVSLANDNPESQIHLQLNPSIYPSPGEICKAQQCLHPSSRTARYQIALSVAQDLVAVGLGSKIHIYPVRQRTASPESRQQYVEYIFQGPSLTWIQSLEFVESDTLLRCEIDSAGTTLFQYRGFGRTPQEKQLHGLEYWKSALEHIYLASDTIPHVQGFNIRDICLLPTDKPKSVSPGAPSKDSRAFAALIERDGKKIYAICKRESHVQATSSIKLELPSRPESKVSDESGYLAAVPRWHPANVPLAQSSRPIMAVSDDGRLLAIYEPGELQARCEPQRSRVGALYVCSLVLEPRQCRTKPGSERIGPNRWPLLVEHCCSEIISVRVNLDPDGDGYLIRAQDRTQIFEWVLKRF